MTDCGEMGKGGWEEGAPGSFSTNPMYPFGTFLKTVVNFIYLSAPPTKRVADVSKSIDLL